SPNVTYEREMPQTFELDDDGSYFRGYFLREGADGSLSLERADEHEDIGRDSGFFNSYQRDGRYISFYGDNHPTYAGNVVKAMASAKDGFPEVSRLFHKELAALKAEDQGSRDANATAFF